MYADEGVVEASAAGRVVVGHSLAIVEATGSILLVMRETHTNANKHLCNSRIHARITPQSYKEVSGEHSYMACSHRAVDSIQTLQESARSLATLKTPNVKQCQTMTKTSSCQKPITGYSVHSQATRASNIRLGCVPSNAIRICE
jgi:hypothetical protein